MSKFYQDKSVYEATIERLRLIFEDFNHVLVAFSCGKDSGVLLNLAYQFARETNQLHKLSYYYEDYEAGYKHTHEYAERTFADLKWVRSRYWLCLPISAACSVSMYQNRWIPWDEDQKEIWVRPMPDYSYVVNQQNCPYRFDKGTKGFDARIQFAQWFSENNGKTAVLIGIRADESLQRLSIITSQHRSMMHKQLRYSKVVDSDTVNFYPLYDWKTEDIWIANQRFGFDYNRIYDLYYQAGLSIDQMRIASPFHQCGQANLKLFRVIDPDSWGKMVGRVNGVNFTGIYGGTTAMGWGKITKPNHFTWRQYAEFLMDTLPINSKKKLVETLDRLANTWSEKGYGRNPDVIAAMQADGLIVENTHKIANNCTKPGIYEVIRLKGEFPDEAPTVAQVRGNVFRIMPTWKGVCVTIMKNDFGCLYMGCQRTKDMNLSRNRALARYKKITQETYVESSI